MSKSNKFFRSTYDGNPSEWKLNEAVKSEHPLGPVALLEQVCSDNKFGDDEMPIGPRAWHFDNTEYCILECAWTMGRDIWPFIIVLSTKKMTEDVLDAMLEARGIEIGDEDEEDAECT